MERNKLVILTPFLDDYDVIVYAGDCIDVMRELPEASVDAIVTDPPYALNFMGKAWDSFSGNSVGNACEECGNDDPVVGYRLCLDCLEAADEAALRGSAMLGHVSQNWDKKETHSRGYADNNNQAFQRWTTLWAREAYRILKPGGHLLAFAGTRTYHRMASGVEDAGFEIRDCIAWMYGSGFPKSLDVSKAIDKAAGAERTVKGAPKPGHENFVGRDNMKALREGTMSQAGGFARPWMSDPEAVEAAHWTYEPATPEAEKWNGWGTALKPAYEPIVVARKPLIGTVAANVLEHGTGALNIDACRISTSDKFGGGSKGTSGFAAGYEGDGWQAGSELGRWPANIALDATAAAMLDQQAPDTGGGGFCGGGIGDGAIYGAPGSGQTRTTGRVDANGGASRFFYTAKASRHDRNAGGLADNTHPTVKPTELMRWLIRLVTPPDGIILDPFGGSGSTGLAARAENTRCILIEREPEYLNIIRDRLAQLSLFAIPDEDAA
jgi:site-specific DNA-methyltransferase (adenine-specific)